MSMTPPNPQPDWGRITDWHKWSNASIARELGTTRQKVKDYRRNHGLPHGPRSPGSGLYPRTGERAPAKLPLYKCRQRLEAVWDVLWPGHEGDPVDKDEAARIKEISTIPLANG